MQRGIDSFIHSSYRPGAPAIASSAPDLMILIKARASAHDLKLAELALLLGIWEADSLIYIGSEWLSCASFSTRGWGWGEGAYECVRIYT